jgi:hypothetical protein
VGWASAVQLLYRVCVCLGGRGGGGGGAEFEGRYCRLTFVSAGPVQHAQAREAGAL